MTLESYISIRFSLLGVNNLERENMTGEESFDLEEILRLLDEPTVQWEEAGLDTAPATPVRQCIEEPDSVPKTEEPSEFVNQPEIITQTPVQQESTDKKEAPKMPLGKTVALYMHDLVYLLIGVVVLLCLCFRMVIVDGDSMYNTLVDGDYLLPINNVFYHEPKAGDIVVASKDSFRKGSPIVKRVIATEGQTVDIDFATGNVYVDGKLLQEDYIFSPTTNPEGMSFPLVVEDGCIFVMGDNRGRSKDSRDPEIGLIDKREVLGKAFFLLLPGTDHDKAPRDFSRFGVIS
jgi:signal peptidase I